MFQSPFKRAIFYSSAILCITACIADLVFIYIFGNKIPGYNQLTCTLSELSISTSPVAGLVTVWSVALGFILIFFAFGFREVFRIYGKETLIAFWLITFYALGEDIASGILKADIVNGQLTDMAIVHNILGGIGIIGLLILPFVVTKLLTRFSYPLFFRFSRIISLIGFLSLFCFSFRIHYFANTFLHTYSGLWQRIFLINFYIYFIVIAFMVLKEIRSRNLTPQHLV